MKLVVMERVWEPTEMVWEATESIWEATESTQVTTESIREATESVWDRGVYCSIFPPPAGGGKKCRIKLMGKKMQGWGKKIQG